MKYLKTALLVWALSVGTAFAGPQGFALHDTPQPVMQLLGRCAARALRENAVRRAQHDGHLAQEDLRGQAGAAPA